MATFPHHFPADYRAARDAFRRAAQKSGAACSGEAIRARGHQDEELSIDTAYIGPTAPERLLVVSSGLHGVEGFAGSAIQHRLLTEQLNGFDLLPDTGLLLVHALNPYGFAALRRVNESNVDLNRNFVRHPEEHEQSPDYEALYDVINPERIDPASEDESRKTLLGFAQTHGFPRLQEVLTCGQYQWPRGVQFGGEHDEESNLLLRRLASRETRGATRVAWIDIHTGLGEYAGFELITERAPDDPAYQRGRAWYGDTVRSTVAGESTSAAVHGPMEHGLVDALPQDCEITTFAAEFGTYEPTRVFWAMRLDNWLQHFGELDSEQGRAVKSEILEVFRPDDPVWQERVLEGGAEILECTRVGLLDSD